MNEDCDRKEKSKWELGVNWWWLLESANRNYWQNVGKIMVVKWERMDGWIWKRMDGNGENDWKRERSGVRLGENGGGGETNKQIEAVRENKKNMECYVYFFQKKIKG